jgi:hypothetical protein
MTDKSPTIENQLEELFDIRRAKSRYEKILTQEAMEAQRDIRLIVHMFRDGIPDITIPINDSEAIQWDSSNKSLLLLGPDSTLPLEGSTKQIMIRVRPHLAMLIKQAKEFYKD